MFRGFVGKRHLVLNIRSDHAAGNGCEDVIHQVLERGHFFKSLFKRGEEARVFDGNGGLVGKRGQQVAFGFRKDAGTDAVVGVDHADEFIFYFEGDA